MFRPWVPATLVTAVLTAVAACRTAVPDLSLAEAADIISRAPKFNRYARLVEVQSLLHARGPVNYDSSGKFTFRYLDAPADSAPVLADVDFRYHEGKWYLNQFDFGCPRECHFVYVYDGPAK